MYFEDRPWKKKDDKTEIGKKKEVVRGGKIKAVNNQRLFYPTLL